MRDGGKEGGVGFDQQPVLWQPRGGRLQIGGIAERHDARDRDIEAEVERLFREIVACGKAVDHAGKSRPAHLLAQQSQCIGFGIARTLGLLGAKVATVRTASMHGKVKRQGRYSGRRPDWKKAYVVLAKGQKMVEFFDQA